MIRIPIGWQNLLEILYSKYLIFPKLVYLYRLNQYFGKTQTDLKKKVGFHLSLWNFLIFLILLPKLRLLLSLKSKLGIKMRKKK